jgi:hypothetical protein
MFPSGGGTILIVLIPLAAPGVLLLGWALRRDETAPNKTHYRLEGDGDFVEEHEEPITQDHVRDGCHYFTEPWVRDRPPPLSGVSGWMQHRLGMDAVEAGFRATCGRDAERIRLPGLPALTLCDAHAKIVADRTEHDRVELYDPESEDASHPGSPDGAYTSIAIYDGEGRLRGG